MLTVVCFLSEVFLYIGFHFPTNNRGVNYYIVLIEDYCLYDTPLCV